MAHSLTREACMRPGVVIGTLAVLSALVVVMPAHAITLPDHGDFLFLADRGIRMEAGPVVLAGQVGVNSPQGLLQIGSHNTLLGTAIAHTIIRGSFSRTDTCVFDTSIGDGVCENIATPPSLPLVPSWPPLPVPPVDPCVNAEQDVSVPRNAIANLTAGCFGDVRVGGTLNLGAGTFNFRSLRLLKGAILAGDASTVNVAGLTVTEPQVAIAGLTLNTPASRGEVVQVGRDSALGNVLINAPNGRVHLRAGLLLFS